METTTTTLSGLELLLSIEELSEYLHVPVRTLYDWRLTGKGPCAVHVGRQLRYFVSDVHAWLASQFWLADLDLEAMVAPSTRERDSAFVGGSHPR